jgi:hypothetical protein
MSNGGIIGPVNDPTLVDLTTTFTASGTYTSPGLGPGQADYLVVAGGGGAGYYGGGGGAGGYRTSFPGGTKLSVSGSYPITVGAGGSYGSCAVSGTRGSDSIFSTITSTGGGGGQSYPDSSNPQGPGGSGGGGGQAEANNAPYPGFTGNSPPTSPSQGNSGGAGQGRSFSPGPTFQKYMGGGGGGGAAAVGGNRSEAPNGGGLGGSGGAGSSNSISGSSVNYAGGGGGQSGGGPGGNPGPVNAGGIAPGGIGGGGAGGCGALGCSSVAGTANTGGGGGSGPGPSSGTGGSGIVIVKQYSANRVASGVWSLSEQYNYKKAGQWTPSAPFDVDYLVVAGGGGGGAQNGGGGGAGGFRTSFPGGTKLTLTGSTSFPVTVGAGGTAGIAGPSTSRGVNGNPSIFSSITSTGGGGGGSSSGPLNVGNSGGSGGGSSYIFPGAVGTFPASPLGNPAGNSPPVSPSQGSPGGYGQTIYPASPPGNWIIGGGGGGAGGAGTNGSSYATVTPGGVGLANSITNSPVFYAGGGGGGGAQSNPGITGSIGGNGGGGNASSPTGDDAGGGTATAGTVNTGGGGGANGNGAPNVGAAGGSGIVIIRAPGNAQISASPGTNTVTTLPAPAGGCKVATFTVSGTLTT